jgi:hypothetical protein
MEKRRKALTRGAMAILLAEAAFALFALIMRLVSGFSTASPLGLSAAATSGLVSMAVVILFGSYGVLIVGAALKKAFNPSHAGLVGTTVKFLRYLLISPLYFAEILFDD